MRSIPHLRIPVANGVRGLVTVEQDTGEEIMQSVLVVLRTRPGEVLTSPRLGLPDPTFLAEDAVDTGIAESVQEWEPRADVVDVQVAANKLDAAELRALITRSAS